MNLLQKIRQLSEWKRRVILWAIIIVIGSGLLVLWANSFMKKIQNISEEGFSKGIDISSLKESLDQIQKPSVDLDSINKQIEEGLEGVTNGNEEIINN